MTRSLVIDAAEVTSPLRLLDVRDADSFEAGHAPGAVRVPIEDWIAAARSTEGVRQYRLLD
jgi:rhodanese-related sulfurtransferase